MQSASAACLILIGPLLTAGCDRAMPLLAASHRVVRLVADSTTSQPLAAHYARSLPNLDVRLIRATGSNSTVEAIQRGDADIGFVLADVAYFSNLQLAEREGSSRPQLRGIAALQTAAVHALSRRGETIPAIRRLPAPRLGVNSAFASQSILARLVFGAFGFRENDMAPAPFIANELPKALTHGTVDLMFATAYYPAQPVTDAAQAGAKLLPIDGDVAEHLRHKYPFVRRISIPAHTYPGQPSAVETIGVDRLFVCRSDLDEGVVHDLTQEFFEALPTIFSTLRVSARLLDLDLASATPIPLHPGAAQYYRERELTP